MKKLFFILLVFLSVVCNAQINWTTMGTTSEIVASETLTFSANVELNVRQLIAVGIMIETVNTSNFQGDIYLDYSPNTSYWNLLASYENYTFTQTAGSNGTMLQIFSDDFFGKYIRLRVIAESDAQSINITPYYKSIKGYR